MVFDSSLICFALSSSSGLSTEGRFLLLCVMYEYSIDNRPVDMSVNRLVKQYGVTRTTCSKLTKYLASSDNKVVDIRRTKLRTCEFDSAGLSMLITHCDDSKQVSNHQTIIVNLLTKRAKDNENLRDDNNQNKLRVANLLLLIILLVYSDRMGAVRGLSKAKIRKLMGDISVDKLNSQLKALNERDYILVSSSGGSGRKLFGRVSNNYILNLGHLQGRKYKFDNEVTFNTISILDMLENTVRDFQKIRHVNKGSIKKDIKSLVELLGDDLRADMQITSLILNKCESIVSTILTKHWDDMDTFDFHQYKYIDVLIPPSLLTRAGLFSVSYIEKNMCASLNKMMKEKYKNEFIVTNYSFEKWLNEDSSNAPALQQAHQLIMFLLKQSLAIAKAIKELLVFSNPELKNPDDVMIGFGSVVIYGDKKDRHTLSVILAGGERYDVYSVSASRSYRKDFTYVINAKEY